MLQGISPGWREEFAFAPWRKWRFDFALPEKKIAVEINGNAWNTKGGGRHGNPIDLQKMNAAQAMGWRVFQFGTSMKEMARMVAEVSFHVGGAGAIEKAFGIELVKKERMK